MTCYCIRHLKASSLTATVTTITTISTSHASGQQDGPIFFILTPISGSKLNLDDLLSPLASQSSALQSLKTSMKVLVSSSSKPKTLSAPLPQRTQERLDRQAAYEQTEEEVDKWSAGAREGDDDKKGALGEFFSSYLLKLTNVSYILKTYATGLAATMKTGSNEGWGGLGKATMTKKGPNNARCVIWAPT